MRAERRFEPQEGDELVVAERPQGTYARQVFLGDTLDAENVQADCQLGVLTLTIPVAETAKPRQVPVSGGQEAQTIEPLDGRRRRGQPRAGRRSRPPATRRRAARAEPPIQLQLRDGGAPPPPRRSCGRSRSSSRDAASHAPRSRACVPEPTDPPGSPGP